MGASMRHLGKLTLVFTCYKLAQLIVIGITPTTFDSSLQLIVAKYPTPTGACYSFLFRHILQKLLVWDAVYFTDLAIEGIKWEHQYVFCPLWWRLIRMMAGEGLHKKLVMSIVVSNALHFATIILVYVLTRQTFDRKDTKFAYYSAMAAVLAPAGVFLTAGYSENLSNVLSMAQLVLYSLSFDDTDYRSPSGRFLKGVIPYSLSGLALALNFMVRANTLLLGLLYIHDLWEALVYNDNIIDAFWACAAGGQLFMAIVWQNWSSYRVFCPERGEWCNNRIPSLFGYAQLTYWEVGFLKYWKIGNIPNFLIALPVICLNCLAIAHFWRELPKMRRLRPLLEVNIALLTGAVFFWNVQIINRISSFLPVTYWYIAQEIQRGRGKRWLTYMIGYGLLQASMFAAFLPPA